MLGKITHDDTFIVEKRGGLDSTELVSRDVNWVSGEVPAELFRAKVKIRYTTKEVEARVMSVGEDQVKVQLDEPQRDVTARGAAVFYQGDLLLNEGIMQQD